MMRRKALWICSMMVALALIPAINLVQAPSVTTTPRWITPVYNGYDSYHGTTVVAYTAGTDATLVLQVYNDRAKTPFSVYVHMDWATTNETSDPVEVLQNQYHTFQMAIPVATTASTSVLHSYRILVKYEDTWTTPGTTIVRWMGPYTGSNFAVYSADQTDAQLTREEYYDWRNSYTPSLFGMTSNAKELWIKGTVEESMGYESYRTGSFSDAKTHYGNALNYTKQAITTDIEKTATFEDALIGIVDAGKSFLSMQGYAYIIASIGFLFMGIGAMIYLIRRSGHPVT